MDLGRILGCTTCCVKATPKEPAVAKWEPQASHIEPEKLFPAPAVEESPAPPPQRISSSARPPQLASRQGFFMVRVEKTKAETWALDLNFGRLKRLSVLKVREGPITRWNEANPDKMIETGDWIEKVNETMNVPQAMVQALLTSDKLELLVRKTWYTGQIHPEVDDESIACENASHCSLPPDEAQQPIKTVQPAPEQDVAGLSNSKQAHPSKKSSANAPCKLERIESADSVSTCPGASESSASVTAHRSFQSPESTSMPPRSDTSDFSGSCQEIRSHQAMLPSDVPALLETQSEQEVARQIADACCEELFSEDRSEYSQTWENLANSETKDNADEDLATMPETGCSSEGNIEVIQNTQAHSKPRVQSGEELLSASSSLCLSERQSLATVPETASNSEDHIETASNSEERIESLCSTQPKSEPMAPADQELSSDSFSCLTTRQSLAAVPETASSAEASQRNSKPTAPADQELFSEHSSACSTAREIPAVPEIVSNSKVSELTAPADEEPAELFPCKIPNRRRSYDRPQRMQTDIGRRLSDNTPRRAPNAVLEQRMRDCLDKVTDLEQLAAAQPDWDPPEEFRSAVLKVSRELETVGREALEDGCSRQVPGAMEIFEEHNHALDRLAVLLETKVPAQSPMSRQKHRKNIGIAYGIGLLTCLLGCAAGFIR